MPDKTSLKLFQEKIGVTADGAWGPNTLKAAVKYLNISPLRGAHFFAQCAHESGNFLYPQENLNYNAEGLTKTFSKYFPNIESTKAYAGNPEKIANKVYSNRMGNQNEESGDGWKFRGRGAIQLTGKSNYIAFSKYMKTPKIMENPDLVANQFFIESALFFFEHNALWKICDKGIDDATITELTKRINGGTLGLAERISKTKEYATILGA